MANEAFQPGDIVKLKSGGPSMVVVKVSDNVGCRWWNPTSSSYDYSSLNAFELKTATADR